VSTPEKRNEKKRKSRWGRGEKIRHKEKKAEPRTRKGVMEENRKKEWWGTSGQRNWKKQVENETEEK